eukprot:490241-Heterocapsa_arctica.AAC.1
MLGKALAMSKKWKQAPSRCFFKFHNRVMTKMSASSLRRPGTYPNECGSHVNVARCHSEPKKDFPASSSRCSPRFATHPFLPLYFGMGACRLVCPLNRQV